MARPAPTILLHHESKTQWLDVLAAPKPSVVLYKGEPFSVRYCTPVTSYSPKYLKTAFPHPGHALRLATKLNKMFNTEDFTVSEMT
jgi:hypothetical protein